MGLFDSITGTRKAEPGVEVQPGAHVRDALLAVATPDTPYTVREGTPDENADLVAEWRLQEPQWRVYFYTRDVSRQLQIFMRLHEDDHEVRALDKQSTVVWETDGAGLSLRAEKSWQRGTVKTKSFQGTIELGSDDPEIEKTFSFSSEELKDPLRRAILDCGWGWRGVSFGKL